MAVDTIIVNSAAIAACNAIVDLLDAGSGAGKLKIYSGTVPTDADAALAGNTLLAELTLSDPAFGNAADDTGKATATASSITADSSADATGTASFFRATDSDDNVVIQGTCGTSDADLVLNSTSIQSGVEVQISSWTFSVPEQA